MCSLPAVLLFTIFRCLKLAGSLKRRIVQQNCSSCFTASVYDGLTKSTEVLGYYKSKGECFLSVQSFAKFQNLVNSMQVACWSNDATDQRLWNIIAVRFGDFVLKFKPKVGLHISEQWRAACVVYATLYL